MLRFVVIPGGEAEQLRNGVRVAKLTGSVVLEPMRGVVALCRRAAVLAVRAGEVLAAEVFRVRRRDVPGAVLVQAADRADRAPGRLAEFATELPHQRQSASR